MTDLQLSPTLKIERQKRLLSQSKLFQQLFGEGKIHVWRAPARINILGEHVDYVSYLPTASLPFGSHEHEMVMMYRPNNSGKVRGASTRAEFAPFSFDLNEADKLVGESWTEAVYKMSPITAHWSNYVKGACFFALRKYACSPQQGFDFVIDSGIPPQGGSSSSSALVVLSGAAIRQINDIEYSMAELAQDSAQAEWYVGTRGGALDHTTICLSRRHHAVHLSYATNEAELIPLPDDSYRWITFFTEAADKGQAVMLEYNERAAVSRLIIPALLQQQLMGEGSAIKSTLEPENVLQLLHSLPEAVTLAEMQSQHPETFHQCQMAFPALVQARLTLSLKVRDRALHHWGEVARVDAAINLLNSPDNQREAMRELGKLLNQSHASLRDLYEISTPMVNELFELVAAESFGARMIGGGFGGNVLALITSDQIESLLSKVQNSFYAPRNRDGNREGAIMISTPGDGLAEIAPTFV